LNVVGLLRTVATSSPPGLIAPEEVGFEGDEQANTAPDAATAASAAANVLIDVALRAATTRQCLVKNCPTGQKTVRSKTWALSGKPSDLRAESLWPPFRARRSGQLSGHLTMEGAAA